MILTFRQACPPRLAPPHIHRPLNSLQGCPRITTSIPTSTGPNFDCPSQRSCPWRRNYYKRHRHIPSLHHFLSSLRHHHNEFRYRNRLKHLSHPRILPFLPRRTLQSVPRPAFLLPELHLLITLRPSLVLDGLIDNFANLPASSRAAAIDDYLLRINHLSDKVKDAASYLPPYDQRKYSEVFAMHLLRRE